MPPFFFGCDPHQMEKLEFQPWAGACPLPYSGFPESLSALLYSTDSLFSLA